MRHIVEIKKAEKLVFNFEVLPASDIKNIVPFLMNAINFYLKSEGYNNMDVDFFHINGVKNKKELFEIYFFLKSLESKDFLKTDRKSIMVRGWKNNVYLKKDYFSQVLKKTKNIIIR